MRKMTCQRHQQCGCVPGFVMAESHPATFDADTDGDPDPDPDPDLSSPLTFSDSFYLPGRGPPLFASLLSS